MSASSRSVCHCALKLPMHSPKYSQKPNPRREYRQQESERVNASPTIADTFQDLKALTVELTYYGPGSFSRNSEIKYSVNLANAKSRFRFGCPNDQCVGGDFDLSTELVRVVSEHHTQVDGEMVCQGWHSQTEIGQAYCHSRLRYKLNAEYRTDKSLV
jgi:hypothetical protein